MGLSEHVAELEKWFLVATASLARLEPVTFAHVDIDAAFEALRDLCDIALDVRREE